MVEPWPWRRPDLEHYILKAGQSEKVAQMRVLPSARPIHRFLSSQHSLTGEQHPGLFAAFISPSTSLHRDGPPGSFFSPATLLHPGLPLTLSSALPWMLLLTRLAAR